MRGSRIINAHKNKKFNENLENFFVRNRLYIIIIDKNKIYRPKYNDTAV